MEVGSFGKTRPAEDRGFTLVELLVTIAIIAIIAAILFPVVIKVKEAAKIADCLSNMRQVGAGLHMYLDENDLRFPPAAPWGRPSYWRQNGGQKTIQECLVPYVRNGMIKGKDNFYQKTGVFVCPSDTGIASQPGTIYGVPPRQPLWKYTGSSYEYYASNQEDPLSSDSRNTGKREPIRWTALSPEILGPKGLQRLGAPFRAVIYPTKKAVLGDMWYWHMGDTIPVDRLAFRNTLFADGHAARVQGTEHLTARGQMALAPWHSFREIEE